MPNKETFKIKPIKKLLNKYVGVGHGWIDSFAGNNSPAEFTNDLNPETSAKDHMYAIAYCKQFRKVFDGVLFDPPYSQRQIKECYEGIGLAKMQLNTFYKDVKDVLARKVVVGGLVICFGWNSNSFGKKRGFDLVEILLVAHGGNHNDTIVTIEKKVQRTLEVK